MVQFKFKIKPFAHQLKALTESCDLPEYALFMEMGTGKSKVLIDTVAYLYSQGKIDGVLILAPKGVYRTWFNIDKKYTKTGQIVEHLPDYIEWYAAYWSSYKTAERIRALEQLFKTSDKLHFLVMNIEAFSTKNGVEFATKFLRCHTALMAIDESTTIKNPKALRTKAAVKLGKTVKYKRILSGMPVTRAPLDLYAQCTFLNWHLLGFSSYYSFRNRYAVMQKVQLGNRVFDKVIGYQRTEELTKLINKFSFRVTKAECLDLPEKVYMYREIDLTPEQEKIYNQMKNLSLAQLSDCSVVTVQMVMTKIQKLHEIVCGFLKDPETGVTSEIPNNRQSEVLEVLGEIDKKAIIWSNNTYDINKLYDIISDEYGMDVVAKFYGDTPDDLREEIKARFQNPNDPLRFLISNPSTGKFGMTLTEAKYVIYYSNSYNLEDRIQSEDRAHRIGQTDKVTYIDFITRDTVDQKIIEALKSKNDLSHMVMGDDYHKWLE
jgi:SNF2 family DNA or RNA helicase